MRKLYKFEKSYNLLIQGQELREEMRRDSVFHAIEFAYKQMPDNETNMVFTIWQRDTTNPQADFAMPHLMWSALCESPEVMSIYLRLRGFD